LLPPFSTDEERRTLRRTLLLESGAVVHCLLTSRGRELRVRVHSTCPLSSPDRREVRLHLRCCLRMDEDFSEFHAEARRRPPYRWIAQSGSGRLLRSPTVFEDAVKMICTTNCTWALTTAMVSALVRKMGDGDDAIGRAFPRPATIAAASEGELRRGFTTGYRAPYILELSRRVASGELDIESWRSSTLQTEELFAEICTVKGMGPYAAGNILRLLGRYEHLALDSWVRGQYYRIHTRNRPVEDRTIERHYRQMGRWRGLFFWLEMTRHWHEEKFRA
jgi:3-methyladenine DNA glycosylase/8-oxoguanine DNA glycosylase